MIDHSVIVRGLLRALDDGKFNTPERVAKLRNKEQSLRRIGSHTEADLFKQKISELSGSAFEAKHPRDNDGQFAESGSSGGSNSSGAKTSKGQRPTAAAGGASSQTVSRKENAEMQSALKADGFEQAKFSPGTFTAKRRDGMHSIKIDNTTGIWKYYSPWDAPSVKGTGAASLKEFLRKQSATDNSSIIHPIWYPRQADGKFGRGGTAKPHRKMDDDMKKNVKDTKSPAKGTRDNQSMANAGDPARLAETFRSAPSQDKATVIIRKMLATLKPAKKQSQRIRLPNE